jgi:signal transduction histidine kinase
MSEYAVARERAVTELARTDAELVQRLAERTLERDGAARAEALTELDRTNAELAFRLAERTIERDDVAREEAVAELLRTNAELKQRLAKRTLERDEAARENAALELLRSSAELKQRLVERTIERDDVAREEAVAELSRTNAELKNRLAGRTIERDTVARVEAAAELRRTDAAEEQSRLHAAELEALNTELESFSYSVSHDLRSPVRAVLGYSRALEEDYGAVLDDEGRRLLSVVYREATRMGHLIDDLLAFSQLGRQPIVRTLVDMASLVDEVVIEQTALAGHAPSVFHVDPLPAVYGDRALLRQVWTNLVSNALKYSSKSAEPRLSIWATAEAVRIVYNVRDNGVGFEMAYASKLFGVFQRLHRSEDFAGTGVGLAIAHRVVQRHGGTIWAEAELGSGATFSFALPTGIEE